MRRQLLAKGIGESARIGTPLLFYSRRDKMACEHCNEMDEALDIVCKELDKQRRAKRELIRTIRILKQSIINEMEEEHEVESNRTEYITVSDNFMGRVLHEVKPLYVSRFLTGVETGPVSQADGHVDED